MAIIALSISFNHSILCIESCICLHPLDFDFPGSLWAMLLCSKGKILIYKSKNPQSNEKPSLIAYSSDIDSTSPSPISTMSRDIASGSESGSGHYYYVCKDKCECNGPCVWQDKEPLKPEDLEFDPLQSKDESEEESEDKSEEPHLRLDVSARGNESEDLGNENNGIP